MKLIPKIFRYIRRKLTKKKRVKIKSFPFVRINPHNSSKIKLNKFPYPYSAMVSISNDCEYMTFDCFKDMYRMITDRNGFDLETSTSMFFYVTNSMCHSSFGYFSNLEGDIGPQAQTLREMIQAGYIDTIHAYGDFDEGGFEIKMAEKVLEECSKYNLKIPIWSNHGSNKNIQNLGHKNLTQYQRGDLLEDSSYHLDILRKIGMKYAWVDDGHIKYPSENIPTIYREIARDNSELALFRRYRGLVGKPAPMARSLPEQIKIDDIKRLIKVQGSCIYYQHLGVWEKVGNRRFKENREPYFCDKALEVFSFLSEMQRQGKCLTATTARLLKFLDLRDSLRFEMDDQIIVVETPNKDFTDSDCEGLNFTIKKPNRPSNYKILFRNSDDSEQFLQTHIIETANDELVISVPWKKLQEFAW